MTDAPDAAATRARAADLRRRLLAARQGGDAAAASAPPQLTPIQRDLWAAETLGQAGSGYSTQRAWRLRGPLDTAALAQAVAAVVARHDALSLRIPTAAGVPVPVFDAAPAGAAGIVTETAPAGPDPEAWLAARVSALVRRRFDLAQGPLFAVHLLRLSDEDAVLVWVLHHLISDDWSLSVIARDLGHFYAVALGQEAPPLPDIGAGYRGFLAAGAAAPPDPAEPADTPGPDGDAPWPRAGRAEEDPADPARARSVSAALSPAELAGLRAAARRLGVSVFELMAALYRVLLARLCDADGVAIAVSRTARLSAADEAAVGMFLDHVALGGATPPDVTLGALAGEIAATLRDRPRAPYAPARGPVARATLVTYPRMDPAPALPGLTATVFRPRERGIPVDLHLGAHPAGEGLELVLSGRIALFEPVLLERLLAAIRRQMALVAAAAAPEALRLFDLPLFADDAEPVALAAAAARPGAGPDGQDIASRFLAVAAAAPEAPAFRSPALRWTYGALAREAAAVAVALREAGLRPGDVLGLALPRGADLVRATLGALHAGLTLAPIDPGYPEARRAEMAAQAGCALILAPAADPADPRLRMLPPRLGDAAAGGGALPAADPRDPDATAFLVFTSGSTGRPKGVQTTHRSILRLAAGLEPRRPGPGDRMALIASPSFDGAFIEIFGALLTGAELVSPEGDPGDHRDIAAMFRAQGVTHAFVTTGLFNLILDSDPRAFDGFRWVATGGEAMSADHAMRFLRAHPGVDLVNVYGPTENGALTTAHRVTTRDRRLVPIGRPLPGNATFVLGRDGRPVPPGFAGELWIGGPGLARGYAGLPEQTAAAFREVPRARLGLPGEGAMRLYATGDRVVLREDGLLCYNGRRDAQVKLSGYRIELPEIEAALRRVPGVRDAMVLPRREGPEGRVVALEAGVVADAALCEGQGAALRRALRAELPGFMVPSVFLPLDALPLTPNGKRDAATLARLLAARRQGDGVGAAGLDPALVAIWTEFAGPPDAGAASDFFLSGGQSLSAMQMLAAVEARFGRRIPIADFFDAPTLGGLAALVAGPAARPQGRHLVLLRDGPRDGPPMVVATGLHGACIWARDMLEALPATGGPVHGLNLAPSDPEAARVSSLQSLARVMVDEIEAACPQGGVTLIGYSFAGFFAFVLAAEMERRGRPPARLIQIDPNANFLPPDAPAPPKGEGAAARLAALRRECSLMPVATPVDYIFCASAFPRPRRRDAEEWAALAQGGVRVHRVQTSHLAVIYGAWAKVLAALVDGILSGRAVPEAQLDRALPPADIARIYAARDAMVEGRPAEAAATAAALQAGAGQGLGFLAVLEVRALAQAGETARLVARAEAEVARRDPDPALLGEIGRLLLRAEKARVARRVFRRLLDLSGPEVQGAFELVDMHMARGQPWRAAWIARLAERRGRSPITGLLCRARIARGRGLRGEAFDLILAALGRSDAGVPHIATVLDRILKPQDHPLALSMISAAETQFRGADILARLRRDWEGHAAADKRDARAPAQAPSADTRSGARSSR